MTAILSLPIGEISHIPIICGPTASGKSSLAISLCKTVNGELLSMDSMQIYRGMDIGTAKSTADEQSGVPHHLLDIADPHELFSVAAYLEFAYDAIQQVLSREVLPVFCGGTGQYASALVEGIDFAPVVITNEVRNEVFELFLKDGGISAYRELERVDPESAAAIHPNNSKRVIRALEVYRQSNQTLSSFRKSSKDLGPKYPFRVFVIDIPREELYIRIDDRVDQMIEKGLQAEVLRLKNMGVDLTMNSMQAIGYKEFLEFFDNVRSYEDTVSLIKQRTRNYAKRQITWYKKIKDAIWISPDDVGIILDSITLDYA